ncbi:universal stress protein [Caballeronia ptereochthonis]|uniref:UspA domain-containing protein n=1 Tax=Caballeronia ptereochthonis TaxID=1777144 RepID=A0A158DIW2_9BURK|nr:universal stress protein [Caballeronia ptereochthonis]SAK93747.1 UspA domain-containing protein [Caballeronia ptereochthonis]
MTYKTVAVQLDTSAHAVRRLDAAVSLAERFDAHLLGLYSDFTLDPRFYCQADLWHRYEMPLQALCLERRERVERMFRGRLAASKVTRDWLADEMTAGCSLVDRARCAGLTLVGQHDSQEPDAHLADRYPEHTIMGAGGPVLVWPREHAPSPLDGMAVIAWDGGREAARAGFDALPLLRRARRVDIVSIRAERDAPLADGRAAPDFMRSLIRHAVSVNVVELTVRDKAHVEAALMSFLQSERARLLIMGAFHHSRLREAFLGGLTRAALRDANVPVLMSN